MPTIPEAPYGGYQKGPLTPWRVRGPKPIRMQTARCSQLKATFDQLADWASSLGAGAECARHQPPEASGQGSGGGLNAGSAAPGWMFTPGVDWMFTPGVGWKFTPGALAPGAGLLG